MLAQVGFELESPSSNRHKRQFFPLASPRDGTRRPNVNPITLPAQQIWVGGQKAILKTKKAGWGWGAAIPQPALATLQRRQAEKLSAQRQKIHSIDKG